MPKIFNIIFEFEIRSLEKFRFKFGSFLFFLAGTLGPRGSPCRCFLTVLLNIWICLSILHLHLRISILLRRLRKLPQLSLLWSLEEVELNSCLDKQVSDPTPNYATISAPVSIFLLIYFAFNFWKCKSEEALIIFIYLLLSLSKLLKL